MTAFWPNALVRSPGSAADGMMPPVRSCDASAVRTGLFLPGADADTEEAWLIRVMTNVSLFALMNGAAEISWRVTLPGGADRAHGETIMLSAALHTSEQTGLPLRQARVCSPAAAFGAYIRNESALDLRGGYAVIDHGGAHTGLSVCLHGISRPAAVCMLPMSARSMLTEHLLLHPADLLHDFEDAQDPALREATASLSRRQMTGSTGLARLRETQFSLDRLSARHAPAMLRHMNERAVNDRMTAAQSVLLLYEAFTLTLLGLMQEQVRQDTTQNDLLPPMLPVCLSGLGAAWLRGMDQRVQGKLWKFLRICMSREHPVLSQPPVMATPSGCEIASGLLQLTGQESAEDIPAPSLRGRLLRTPEEMMIRFFLMFRAEFPDAA